MITTSLVELPPRQGTDSKSFTGYELCLEPIKRGRGPHYCHKPKGHEKTLLGMLENKTHVCNCKGMP